MDILIERNKSTPEGTPGHLDTGQGFDCDTLELQWANNKRGISCILPDTYNAWIWYSPTLGREVVRLEDKNGRFDCLLHNGNFASQVPGQITQIHGCTEVGRGYAQIKTPQQGYITQFGILHSIKTLESLIAHIKEKVGAGPFTVTYKWKPGCEPDDMIESQEVNHG